MRKLIPTALLGVTGLAAAGLIGMQAPVVASTGEDEVTKREDDTPSLVLVADDDDDDTHDGDDTGQTRTRTGASADTDDNTRSNVTGVSRDRDLSSGDKTRDWTRDGGDPTRDRSAGHTNDRSRNDTRG